MQETKKQPELPITILENPVVVGGKYGSYLSDFLKNTKGDLFALIDRKTEEITKDGAIVGWRINVNKIVEDIKDNFFQTYVVLQPEGFIKNYTINGEDVLVTDISNDGTKLRVKTSTGEDLGRCYFDSQDSTKLSRFQLNGEDVLVTDISNDGTKLRVKTSTGEDLGRCYVDPQDSTKLRTVKLLNEDVLITDISNDGTKIRAKKSTGKDLGRYYLDPQDSTKLRTVKLFNEDVLITDILKDLTKVRAKTSTGKDLGRYYLDPQDSTKLRTVKLLDEDVLVINYSKDLTKVRVKTSTGEDLGRCYVDPQYPTKLSRFQLDGKNILITNISNDGTKLRVKTSIGEDLGRCYVDPQYPTKLLRFQLDGKNVLITNISEDGTKLMVKTSTGKSLGRCYVDPTLGSVMQFTMDNEKVYIVDISNDISENDGTKVKVKTLEGKDLGEYYLDPDDQTKVWIVKLGERILGVRYLSKDGSEVSLKFLKGPYIPYINNRFIFYYSDSLSLDLKCCTDPDDRTKVWIVKLGKKNMLVLRKTYYEDNKNIKYISIADELTGEYVGDCCVDPDDKRKVWALKLGDQDVLVAELNGKKVCIKTLDGGYLGRYYFDPNDQTKIRCDEYGLPVIDHNEDDSTITVRTPNGLNVTKQRKKDDDTVTK